MLHFTKPLHNGVTQEGRLPNRIFRSRRVAIGKVAPPRHGKPDVTVRKTAESGKRGMAALNDGLTLSVVSWLEAAGQL